MKTEKEITEEKYINAFYKITTTYEVGAAFLFALGCVLFVASFIYGSIASFVFMFIFKSQEIRITRKAGRIKLK